MADTTRDEARDAREIGALVSKGMLPEEIASKVDLPLGYVNKLTEHNEFRLALKKFGGEEALLRWEEYTSEKRVKASLRTNVRENIQEYFDILHEIATNTKSKAEVRYNVIKFLLEGSQIMKEEAPPPQVQELPPTFFAALVAAEREMDKPIVQDDDSSV